MECAARGLATDLCADGAHRRCGSCGAVAYCSRAHQILHWRVHKGECERLAKQMSHIDMLSQFPFTFSMEPLEQNHSFPIRCYFLQSMKLHQKGLWKPECMCGPEVASLDDLSNAAEWNLKSSLCPCIEPENLVPISLSSWKDYYHWRSLPLDSPVAVVLHWGLRKSYFSLRCLGNCVRYFPVSMCTLNLWVRQFLNQGMVRFAVTLRLWKGFYHERYSDIMKDSNPHLIFAPNAGVAAYSSWMPTIELIRGTGIPAFFTDFCEEAAHLASGCISSITGQPLRVPVQVNPFRQPIAVDNTALFLPCYSNCFVLGM
ncbi:hypothetical protein QOZ80_7BG0598710 [Eleusine coracana subsp. coracana]|nr:hypothetical protein QOZ80_7BG0598710 [Eleusine coracana subsp. coracana]